MLTNDEIDAHLAHMCHIVGRMAEEDIKWYTARAEQATDPEERERCLKQVERARAVDSTPPKPHAERVEERMRRWREARAKAEASSPQES